MNVARQILFATVAIVSGMAILFVAIDLMTWVELPDYWKPIHLGHDLIDNELRYRAWKLDREYSPFLWVPLIPLLFAFTMNRSLLITRLGSAALFAFIAYYLSLATFAWPTIAAARQ